MRICVFGMGAIGGLFAYRLAAAGQDVSCVARGVTLAALRGLGLGLVDDEGRRSYVALRAASDPKELGTQDLVIIAVKAPALAEVASRVAPLLGPDTTVIPAMNGVPWWFFHGLGGALEGVALRSVDPDGGIAAAIAPSRVLGCVIHLGASCPEPGLVKALPLRRLILGDPSGTPGDPSGSPSDPSSARLRAAAGALRGAGFEVEETTRIQSEIWYKLWGNMTMNPLSALTGATMDRIIDDPLVARFCMDVMAEAKRIGSLIGCPIEQTEEDRMAISRTLGAFKTSMLQDVEARRPVELDALVSSVREIAGLLGLETPSIDVLLGLARLHARTLGLYPR